MSPAPPRSLLFLSCDLTGSTQYKQAQIVSSTRSGEQHGSPWQKVFLQFYWEFPQAIATALVDNDSALKFDLWKAVGDELIFTCEVRAEDDVYDAIRIF